MARSPLMIERPGRSLILPFWMNRPKLNRPRSVSRQPNRSPFDVQLERARRLQRRAHPPLDLGPDEVEALVVDRIFEPRPGALGTVTVIALNAHDRIGARNQPALRDEADDIGEARIGAGLIVGAAHPAADRDVESLDAGISGDGDETQVLGVDVDVVRRRDDEADLELSRQILAPVEGLLVFARRNALLAVPDLVIAASSSE